MAHDTSAISQLWRLISRNLAFTSSVDFLISVLLIYNTSITLERRYGTVKYTVGHTALPVRPKYSRHMG